MVPGTTKSIPNNILHYCISLGTLLIIVSSGISTSLRLVGLLLISLAFIVHLLKGEIKVPLYIVLACSSFCLCFLLGLIRTTMIGNDYSEIYWLTILLIILLPFFIIIYSSFGSLYLSDVISFISWALIIIFFLLFISLLFLRQIYGASILIFLRNFSGGFYYRPFLFFDYYPLIWFQASIMAMPLAIYCLFKKKMTLFLLLSFVVVLSLNRTGSFLVIFVYLISLINNQRMIAKYFLYFMLSLPVVFLLACFILTTLYSKNTINIDTGFSIRVGHVLSIMDYMVKPDNFFLGMGADSLFTTIGRDGDGIVRNQEISFLEVFRRFGIFGYFLFNFGLCITLIFFYNRLNWSSFYSLFAYIVFSFTNPNLISFIFVIFYAIISSADLKRVYSGNHYNIQPRAEPFF